MPQTPTIQLKPKIGHSLPYFLSGLIFAFFGVALIAIAILGDARTDPLAWVLKILLILFAVYTLLIGVIFLLAHRLTLLTVDGERITYRSIFHSITIAWPEISGYKLSKGAFMLVCKKNASYQRGPLSRMIWGKAEQQVEIPIYLFVAGIKWSEDWEKDTLLKLVREKSPVEIGEVMRGAVKAS
jgi:hypothetical protein